MAPVKSFSDARADHQDHQLVLPGQQPPTRPTLTRTTHIRLALALRSRPRPSRRQHTPGPRGQLYWHRD